MGDVRRVGRVGRVGEAGRRPPEAEVRDLMWTAVGLVRERSSLEVAISQLDAWSAAVSPGLEAGGLSDAGWRVASIVTVGRLMARAALRREETRGGHTRTDFPARDDVKFKVHIVS